MFFCFWHFSLYLSKEVLLGSVMVDVDIVGLFVHCFPSMICNVDEMMVRLYNSPHTYVCGVVCLFSSFSHIQLCNLLHLNQYLSM